MNTDILINALATPPPGASLVFGEIDSNLQLTLDNSTAALRGQPTTLVRLEPNRRFCGIQFDRTLVITGLVGGSDSTPVGTIVPFSGTEIPRGYTLADAGLLSRTAYPDLFRLWGTRYGAGDGVTTFRKPDYRGRTLVGVDPVQGEFASLGQTGGAKTHTLSEGEMPPHGHGLHPWEIIMAAGGNTGYWGMGGGNAFLVAQDDRDYGSRASGPAGSSQPHNNLQPYATVNYIIRT